MGGGARQLKSAPNCAVDSTHEAHFETHNWCHNFRRNDLSIPADDPSQSLAGCLAKPLETVRVSGPVESVAQDDCWCQLHRDET